MSKLYTKEQLIEIALYQDPLRKFPADPDTDIVAMHQNANRRKKMLGLMLGFLLAAAPVAYNVAPNKDKARENIKTIKEISWGLKAFWGCTGAIWLLFGTSMGGFVADIIIDDRMRKQTVDRRIKQILELLEIQKTRPLTATEYAKIQQLATFVSGTEIKEPSGDVVSDFTHRVATVDAGYHQSLEKGNLAGADPRVKNAITTGYGVYKLYSNLRQR